MPQEPGEIDPEQDEFDVPKEVTQEEQRVEALVEVGPGDAFYEERDILIVHKLVKRYYTAPPAD